MMKKTFLALGAAAALLLPNVAGAEGFGIVEWSAEGMAMGGARMFAEDDAANVAYNPASITKVKGEALKSSYTYLSPHGQYDMEGVNGAPGEKESGRNVVKPGWAVGTYYVRQINDKEWFGMGAFPRFAMVSKFERGNIGVSSNAFLSKLNGISVTPVYAHKFDKKWTGAVGAEINYVGLELEKNMGGIIPTHTEGESFALGWNAAANYTFDDKNEMGLVYRSKIKHSMEADFNCYGGQLAAYGTLDAYGEVTLPDSWSIGYSHKFDDKTRVELNATRTNWSTYDALNINIDKLGMQESPKNWKDGWRYAIGVERKLSDKYSLMAGFAYDESSIPYDGADFLVPTGNRRTYSIGGQYHDKKHTVAVALGYMDVGDLDIKGHPGTSAKPGDNYTSAHTHDNYVKMASISWQRHF